MLMELPPYETARVPQSKLPFVKMFSFCRLQSAIRTNLSLHKCFKRCEDVMGSYWTVDDREFRKGRHMKRGRPRKYNERDPSATRAQ